MLLFGRRLKAGGERGEREVETKWSHSLQQWTLYLEHGGGGRGGRRRS